MATSPSYLQALPKDEAIAFVTSLQKVRDHLHQELAWMKEQVQQKTIQLQGVEALLSQAKSLGLTALDSDETQDPASIAPEPSSLIEADIPSINDSDLPTSSTFTQSQSKTQQAEDDSTPKPARKSAATGKTTTKAKRTNPPKRGKQSQPTPSSELKQLLKPQFQGQTLTDTVAQILVDASEPLHLDELLNEMYGSLPHETFQRAKTSLANVLSTGMGKRKWRNVDKGFYTAMT